MSAKDPRIEWKAVCDSLAGSSADGESILRILGPRVLKMNSDLLREVLEPDLWLAGDVSLQDLLLPASNGKWPSHNFAGYRWIISETITGLARDWNSKVDLWYPLYLATILLHCETIEGEFGIPASPLCVGIACESAHVLLDREVTGGLLAFLASEMRTRLRTHARCDPKEWLTPIAVGIAALLRLWGTQLILQGAGNGREVTAPWLWHPSEIANSSRPVWQRVLDRDAELTQLLKEWAVEGKIDESEDDGNE